MRELAIFLFFAVTDLAIASRLQGGKGFSGVFFCIAGFVSLIWFGSVWNGLFPPGVAAARRPILTQETPAMVLKIFGWILMSLLTLFLVFSCRK